MEEDFASVIADRRVNAGLSIVIAARHAESLADLQGLVQGQRFDTDLTELGKKQAIALAKRLSGRGITRLISSPLRRTYQTALEIARSSGNQIEVDNRLVDTDFGEWESKPLSSVIEEYPDLYQLWKTQPADVEFPGGERFSQTLSRISNFLESTELPPGSVIVADDNPVKVMLSFALQKPVNEVWNNELDPASVTIFEGNVVNGKNILRSMKVNDYDHLIVEDLRTKKQKLRT
jgi:broad specificity phosphatase PhoE